jgi:Bacterial extracellular solute-binding protein
VTGGKHTDSEMSSLEEITKFDAEKNNLAGMLADIGLLWGRVAEKSGVVPEYAPPSAEALPEGYKAEKGGWVATFAGVPAYVINIDAIASQSLPTPATWDDLLDPKLAGHGGVSTCKTLAIVAGGHPTVTLIAESVRARPISPTGHPRSCRSLGSTWERQTETTSLRHRVRSSSSGRGDLVCEQLEFCQSFSYLSFPIGECGMVALLEEPTG